MNWISIAAEPLLLGLSTGTWCVMYCSPVLLPFLCGREDLSHKKNLSLVGLFLGGRFVTYGILAAALGFAGVLTAEFFDPVFSRQLSYRGFLLCGALLLAGGLLPGFGQRLFRRKDGCACVRGCGTDVPGRNCAAEDRSIAFLSGLSVGLHICPPFWVTAFRCMNFAGEGELFRAVVYFLFFYAGTLPFFLPLGTLPFFVPRLPYLRKIARICQLLVGGYLLIFAALIPLVLGGGQ